MFVVKSAFGDEEYKCKTFNDIKYAILNLTRDEAEANGAVIVANCMCRYDRYIRTNKYTLTRTR